MNIVSISFTTATSVLIKIVGIKKYPAGNGDKNYIYKNREQGKRNNSTYHKIITLYFNLLYTYTHGYIIDDFYNIKSVGITGVSNYF